MTPDLPQKVLDEKCFYCKNRVWKKLREGLVKCVKCNNQMTY